MQCMFQQERTSLMELRGPFDGFVEKAVRASTTCVIMADQSKAKSEPTFRSSSRRSSSW